MSRPYYAPKQIYTGTGSLDTYTFDFKIENLTQLLVVVVNDLDVEVKRVLGTDNTYLSSVVFNSVTGGGTVVLLANLPANYRIALLQANDEPSQSYEFSNKSTFSLKRFENALDFIVGPVQRLSFRARQSFRIHDLDDEEIFNPQLPPGVATKGGCMLVIKDDGSSLNFGPTITEVLTWKNQAEAAAAAALVSEGNALGSANAATASANSAAASAVTATLAKNDAQAAQAATIAAAAQAIIDINNGEIAALAAINGAEAASIINVNAARDAAIVSVNAAEDASIIDVNAVRDAALITVAASTVTAQNAANDAQASAAAAAVSAASITGRYQFLALQTLNTNDKITLHASYPLQMVYVEGNGGDKDLNVLPFVSPPLDGATLTIAGRNNSAVITLFHNDVDYGLVLKGDMYLGKYQTLTVVYDATLKRYIEISRSV